MGEGHRALVPRIASVGTHPAGVGQDDRNLGSGLRRLALLAARRRRLGAAVELHDVDLAVGGPPPAVAEGPDRRPGAARHGDAGPHLQTPIAEGEALARGHARRGELGLGPLAPPVAALGVVEGVDHRLAPPGDDQTSVLHGSVVGLIPLQLAVAHEPLLVGPVGGRAAGLIELVGPHQLVARILGRRSTGRRRFFAGRYRTAAAGGRARCQSDTADKGSSSHRYFHSACCSSRSLVSISPCGMGHTRSCGPR